MYIIYQVTLSGIRFYTGSATRWSNEFPDATELTYREAKKWLKNHLHVNAKMIEKDKYE